MKHIRLIAKPVMRFVLFAFLAFVLHPPVAQAVMIGTDSVVSAKQTQQMRQALQDMLQRDAVKQKLLAHGINPDQVQARVNSLTDEEAQQLAAKFNQLPAGGDALDLLVLVFLVLLITDILGLTDVFPFVKKPARH